MHFNPEDLMQLFCNECYRSPVRLDTLQCKILCESQAFECTDKEFPRQIKVTDDTLDCIRFISRDDYNANRRKNRKYARKRKTDKKTLEIKFT